MTDAARAREIVEAWYPSRANYAAEFTAAIAAALQVARAEGGQAAWEAVNVLMQSGTPTAAIARIAHENVQALKATP